jgi:hypothetical protein
MLRIDWSWKSTKIASKSSKRHLKNESEDEEKEVPSKTKCN